MLAPNTLLQGRYLVNRLLGQGGMGAVYQATDRKFGNAVALKETFYNDLQLRKAFSHEARLLNRLRHAALPVVTDYFSIGERQFLVMQYIPGKDLEQLLDDRKAQGQGVFTSAQVLRWADQLLDALEYLHSQKPPIIHRDIKPQNLKLTPRGEVILLDFGLAKGIVTHQSQVSQSIRGYTPNYASLEQIRGTGTDARSDIYSIGATMYHLLTGEMPQDALTRIAAILMSQPDPLKPIASMNAEVPLPVAEVIEKAMSPSPDQRYSSAAAMRQALRSAASSVQPASLHRAQTLTDEPVKANAAAAEARRRSGKIAADSRRQNGNRPLPPPPVLRPEAPQQEVAQGAAKQAEPPDHVIVLLDKVSKSKAGKDVKSGKDVKERKSWGKDPKVKVAPAAEAKERIPQPPPAPSKGVQGANLRAKGARASALQQNVVKLKQAIRKKDIKGKSFFLKKVRQEREKRLQEAKGKSGLKSLPPSLAIVLLATLTVAVAGYSAFDMWPGLFKRTAEMISTTSTGGGASMMPSRFEALRYYLEIAPSNGAPDQTTIRATGLAPVEGGAKFNFHFKPTEGGYLYLIALSESGVPQTFIASRQMASPAQATNRAAGDFVVPDGGQMFMIQQDAESARFTVIFSKTQLKTPAFLSSQSGRELTAEDRQELVDLRGRYAANTPELVAMKNGNQPFVSVQSPERAANEPIIFDVSIKRAVK